MLEIQVKPGYGEHTTLSFSRLGNECFGSHPSDLIVRCVQKEPSGGFIREGDNLYYHVNLSLIEALESKNSTIKTLDGRSILVTPNEMISPQTKIVIAGEGMPANQSGNLVVDLNEQLKPLETRKRGDLIVKFNIQFPTKILNHHRENILQALHAN